MNDKSMQTAESGQMAEIPTSKLPTVTPSIGNMLFEPGVFERVTRMSEIMAKSKAMVPQYLRGNQSDCMAIIMQAAQWKMDPFAVAAKTYQIKPGAPIGYEAQLVNSIIILNGPFVKRPIYTFFGEWSRVQGKLAEKRNSSGGKYAVPDWKPDDEEGLGVTVTLTVIDEDEPTSMDVLLKQCWPRNSTNWTNDPQQQICYAAIRKMARRHFPDVIMGLYTPDELTHVQPEGEKDITPDNSVENLLPAKTDKHATAISEAIDDIAGAKTLEELKLVGNRIKTGTEEMQDRVRSVYAARKRNLTPTQDDKTNVSHETETVDKDTGEVQGANTDVDPQTLIKMLEDADSLESLDDIMDLAGHMDKRSKEFKDIAGLEKVRRSEMQSGIPQF